MNARTPILIAGAGIGGLATALSLAKHGRASHIFEKRVNPSEEGAGIQIGPNGVRVLRALGVADALQPLTASPGSLRIMDGVSGRELTTLPLGDVIAARHGAPYWSAHRADLHATLLNAVKNTPLISLSLGRAVKAVQSQPSCVTAVLNDGTALDGPAFVAADGLFSSLRSSVSGAGPLQYSGKTAFRSIVASDVLPGVISPASTHIWLAPSAHVVHYPVRGGREIAVIVVISQSEPAQGWGTETTAKQLLSRLHCEAPALQSLVRVPPSWRCWPLMTVPRPFPSAEGRIALIGDAAHPILPFLAQGAVMALEDAVVLGNCLARHQDDVPSALNRYRTVRRPRTDRVARASARNGQIYHLSGAMAAVRNAVLRRSPAKAMLASYDWLYGWHCEGTGH